MLHALCTVICCSSHRYTVFHTHCSAPRVQQANALRQPPATSNRSLSVAAASHLSGCFVLVKCFNTIITIIISPSCRCQGQFFSPLFCSVVFFCLSLVHTASMTALLSGRCEVQQANAPHLLIGIKVIVRPGEAEKKEEKKESVSQRKTGKTWLAVNGRRCCCTSRHRFGKERVEAFCEHLDCILSFSLALLSVFRVFLHP